MAEELELGSKDQLALALAQGKSIRSWARINNVPYVTAQRWAKEREVRRMAEEVRRRAIDRAVGQIAMRSSWVVRSIRRIAETTESDSVRLSALRGLLGDMITVSKYSGLENRVAEVEESLDAQLGNAARAV